MDTTPTNTQKVLIVDDSPTIHTFVKMQLRGEPIELSSAFSGDECLRLLAGGARPDLILLDVEMPTPDGFEVCRKLKSDPETTQIPIVFLTAASSTKQKIQGLELGAADYVTKPFDPAELRARVRASLRTKYLLDLLSKKAMIDGLTGLWNRAYLDQRLAGELSAARRRGRPLACVMADLDHFKRINDEFGHATGDAILRGFARVLTSSARAEDVVCRYGGEEFSILCPEIDARGAACMAERIRVAVASAPLLAGTGSLPITCSFGVADTDGSSCDVLLNADRALYQAKSAGRNRVSCVAEHIPLANSTSYSA